MTLEEKKQFLKDHLHEEVEAWSHAGIRRTVKLLGLSVDGFFFDEVGESWTYAAEIGKPKRRLMKPIELANKWLDFGDEGQNLVIGYDEDSIFTRDYVYSIEEIAAEEHGVRGWRDTPTSELNTSFEVEI